MFNTGSYGSPSWTAINGVSDLKMSRSWDMAEGPTRASRIKRKAKTLFNLEFTGKIKVDETDTNGWVAMLTALHSDTPIDALVLDGNPTDSTLTGTLHGYRLDVHVEKEEQDQSLGAVEFEDFTLTPAMSSNTVNTVVATVTAGSPSYAFTAI